MSKLEDIGLGLILAKINFNVGLRGISWGHGFKITRSITFSKYTPKQGQAAWLWMQENDLPSVIERRVGTIDDIELWMDALEPYIDLLTNKKNYERMSWVLENPMPKAHESFDTFLEWAAQWDNLNDEL